jgi:hypothetical protein
MQLLDDLYDESVITASIVREKAGPGNGGTRVGNGGRNRAGLDGFDDRAMNGRNVTKWDNKWLGRKRFPSDLLLLFVVCAHDMRSVHQSFFLKFFCSVPSRVSENTGNSSLFAIVRTV